MSMEHPEWDYVPLWASDAEDRDGDPREVLLDCLYRMWVQNRRLGYLATGLDTSGDHAEHIGVLYRRVREALLDFDEAEHRARDGEEFQVSRIYSEEREAKARVYHEGRRDGRDRRGDGLPPGPGRRVPRRPGGGPPLEGPLDRRGGARELRVGQGLRRALPGPGRGAPGAREGAPLLQQGPLAPRRGQEGGL